jgi:hypothetical protein
MFVPFDIMRVAYDFLASAKVGLFFCVTQKKDRNELTPITIHTSINKDTAESKIHTQRLHSVNFHSAFEEHKASIVY